LCRKGAAQRKRTLKGGGLPGKARKEMVGATRLGTAARNGDVRKGGGAGETTIKRSMHQKGKKLTGNQKKEDQKGTLPYKKFTAYFDV